MKLKKEKLIEKYNIAFGFFVVAILTILIYNFVSLDIFHINQSHEVTKIYFADNISHAHAKLIELFNEKYENEIEVVPLNLPFTKFTTNERKELLARSLRSDNSLVDVFAVDQIWVSRFAKWAEPLDNYFSEKELNRILDQVLDICKYEKELVCMPLYLDIGILFYRQDIIQQLPDWQALEKRLQQSIEWQELIDISRQHFPNQYTYVYQGKDFEGLICNYAELLGAKGSNIDFVNKKMIQDSLHVASCQFLVDLIHKHKISPQEVTTFSEVSSYRYAMKHDIPFFRGWFSSVNDSLAFGPAAKDMSNLKMANLPHFKGREFKSVFGGWNLMIKKNSEKKEAAIKFLKFVLTNQAQELLFKEADFLFVTKEMYERKDLVNNYTSVDLKNIIQNHIVYRPNLENYTKISDIYSHYLNQAIAGKIGSKVAMEKIANTIFSDKIFIK